MKIIHNHINEYYSYNELYESLKELPCFHLYSNKEKAINDLNYQNQHNFFSGFENNIPVRIFYYEQTNESEFQLYETLFD